MYLNAKELEEQRYFIQDTLLEALGVNAGEGLRIEYDRRVFLKKLLLFYYNAFGIIFKDKYMSHLYFRRAFAQLNAAYGAENYCE